MDAHSARNVSVPEPIFQLYEIIKKRFDSRRCWQEMTELEVWHELCLCILSSNVPYDLAVSCMRHLGEAGMLNSEWILRTRKAGIRIGIELARPIYLPRRKDGFYRKYRFPKVRAKNIVGAAKVVYSDHDGIKPLLLDYDSTVQLRNMIAENVPGLGLKESSHFLRNIGYSSDLAIIDVHIISFLRFLGLVPNGRITITRSIYFELEGVMQQISREHQLDLAILDNAIWHYMRAGYDAC